MSLGRSVRSHIFGAAKVPQLSSHSCHRSREALDLPVHCSYNSYRSCRTLLFLLTFIVAVPRAVSKASFGQLPTGTGRQLSELVFGQ